METFEKAAASEDLGGSKRAMPFGTSFVAATMIAIT